MAPTNSTWASRDGCQPHYPVRNEAHLEERLKEEGAEKARERKLLAGPSLKWAMHDAEFRRQRDVYRERARRGADDETHDRQRTFGVVRVRQVGRAIEDQH